MGLHNFADTRDTLTRGGVLAGLLMYVVEVAPELRLAFARALAPAAPAPVAPAPVARAPLPQAAAAAAAAVGVKVSARGRVVRQTDKGKAVAEALQENAARENADAAVPTTRKLPGVVSVVLPDVRAVAQQLPADAPKSLFFDAWGSFYPVLCDVMAAVLACETNKARKGCIDVLARCENILSHLPPIDVVKFLFAAPLGGEHGTGKVRHESDKVSPEEAKQLFEKAVAVLQKAGPKKDRKRARKALAVLLRRVFPLLSAERKNDLRQTVLHRLLETLKETQSKFVRMARAEIVRVSDEDGSFLQGSLRVHFIVSGDGDAFGANLHAATTTKSFCRLFWSAGKFWCAMCEP